MQKKTNYSVIFKKGTYCQFHKNLLNENHQVFVRSCTKMSDYCISVLTKFKKILVELMIF